MSDPVNLYDAQQAYGFLVSQTAHIEAEVYKNQYPDYDYAALIPIDSSANEWAKVVTFFSMDSVGRAQWQSGAAMDMPFADTVRSKFDHSVSMAAIGYQYNIEELNTARLVPGTNLDSDKADSARMAYEMFMYELAFSGNAEKNMDGLLDYTGVTASDAPADGTSSSRFFAAKTPGQIVRDLNSLLTGIRDGSATVEMADTLLLPDNVFDYMASTQMSAGSDTTVMAYFQRNNSYTARTGQALTIRSHRDLATLATSDEGRAVAYKRDPKVLKLHLPMRHRFLPVWQNGWANFVVPGIFRTGGTEIRRLAAVRYLDRISDTPA